MFRSLTPLVFRASKSGYSKPVFATRQYNTLDPHHGMMTTSMPTVEAAFAHNGALGGLPEEHPQARIARIFKNEREVQGWTNAKAWKIDFADHWENNLIGEPAIDDSVQEMLAHMKFGSKEDAMAFCEENHWAFEIDGINRK